VLYKAHVQNEERDEDSDVVFTEELSGNLFIERGDDCAMQTHRCEESDAISHVNITSYTRIPATNDICHIPQQTKASDIDLQYILTINTPNRILDDAHLYNSGRIPGHATVEYHSSGGAHFIPTYKSPVAEHRYITPTTASSITIDRESARLEVTHSDTEGKSNSSFESSSSRRCPLHTLNTSRISPDVGDCKQSVPRDPRDTGHSKVYGLSQRQGEAADASVEWSYPVANLHNSKFSKVTCKHEVSTIGNV